MQKMKLWVYPTTLGFHDQTQTLADSYNNLVRDIIWVTGFNRDHECGHCEWGRKEVEAGYM